MEVVTKHDLSSLYIPPSDSHKGQNGKLLIIGGSHLFHAASLWALTVASRIVDLVHYCSIPENNDIVAKAKEEFRNGIVVHRNDVESYVTEDNCILIGPGMVRKTGESEMQPMSQSAVTVNSIAEVDRLADEGQQTEALTNYLLRKYPEKRWVIDAGALQMVDIHFIPKGAVLTPHHGEFDGLWKKITDQFPEFNDQILSIEDKVKTAAQKLGCILLLKGPTDIVSNGKECRQVEGGNAGMTKGGTGDVLAGLIAALACNNDPYLATIAGSFLNKAAGDELYTSVGPFFNATDLANEIPKTMKRQLLSSG